MRRLYTVSEAVLSRRGGRCSRASAHEYPIAHTRQQPRPFHPQAQPNCTEAEGRRVDKRRRKRCGRLQKQTASQTLRQHTSPSHSFGTANPLVSASQQARLESSKELHCSLPAASFSRLAEPSPVCAYGTSMQRTSSLTVRSPCAQTRKTYTACNSPATTRRNALPLSGYYARNTRAPHTHTPPCV